MDWLIIVTHYSEIKYVRDDFFLRGRLDGSLIITWQILVYEFLSEDTLPIILYSNKPAANILHFLIHIIAQVNLLSPALFMDHCKIPFLIYPNIKIK